MIMCVIKCVLLIENVKAIFNEELKKEIDERVNSGKHTFQQQITSLKNLQIQIDVEELEQYSRRLSIRIHGVIVTEKQDVFDNVMVMFEEAGARNFDGYIDRGSQVGKTYFDKKSSKKVRSLLLNFQHSSIAQ